ncbi:APOV1 protein, partial [Nicator chloris]|nr:APOV1 protein [Nicator chloris]
MLQSRALVIALILLLSTTLLEVQSKSIIENRCDFLAVPETIAFYFYEAVDKVPPKVRQFFLDTIQSPTVTAARQRLAKGATKFRIMFEQMFEKMQYLWYTGLLGY